MEVMAVDPLSLSKASYKVNGWLILYLKSEDEVTTGDVTELCTKHIEV